MLRNTVRLSAPNADQFCATPSIRSRISLLAIALLAMVLLATHVSPAVAVPITGDPSVDTGWTGGGYSLSNGTYIRGSGNIGYYTYTTAFKIEAGSPLIASGWSVGDTIMALGAKISATAGDLTAANTSWGSTIDPPAVNSQLTSSARIVAKFGVSPTSWIASTTKPITGGNITTTPGGNGLGDTSNGDGGDGAILLSTGINTMTSANHVNSTDAGTLLKFVSTSPTDTVQVYNALAYTGTNLSMDVGRYEYKFSGSVLSSWEVFLNTTKAASILGGSADIPQSGDRVNIAIQRSQNVAQFNDSLMTLPQIVPEPSSLALTVIGIVGLAAWRWRRRSRA